MLDLTNKILTVSEYTEFIKSVLEREVPHTWIRGEVSNFKKQISGHIYFTLKDAGSQLSCVLFKGDAMRQTFSIKEGQQILVYGEINVYEPRGGYQVLVRLVLADGQGKLQLAFEELSRKLAAEGLFDKDKKKAIPTLPRTIGFITASTGAAIKDFMSILKRRGWRGRLIILSSKVQGDGAASELIGQLRLAESLGIFDLLVIGRGGGSLEDLWAFNEESLARAIAACSIPIISAVGHEIDFVLSDFAADCRAETPSAAAEMISSGYLERLSLLLNLVHRLESISPKDLLENVNLRLDDLFNRLIHVLQGKLYLSRQILSDMSRRFLAQSPINKLHLAQQYLEQLKKRLYSASVENILKRGYALIKTGKGVCVKSKAEVKVEEVLTAQFYDGSVDVKIIQK